MRKDIEMDRGEMAAFLGRNRKLQLATLSPTGSPHLATLWYGLKGDSIVCWTYRKSQKARNLGRDARVAAVIEEGESYDELRGVSITGWAELLLDRQAVIEIALAVSRDPEHARGRIEAQADKRVGIVIHPDHIASWDHAKLA